MSLLRMSVSTFLRVWASRYVGNRDSQARLDGSCLQGLSAAAETFATMMGPCSKRIVGRSFGPASL